MLLGKDLSLPNQTFIYGDIDEDDVSYKAPDNIYLNMVVTGSDK